MIGGPVVQAYRVSQAAVGTSTRVLTLQVLGAGAEGQTEGVETGDGVELVQPLGLFVSPVITANLEVFGVELGDEIIGLLMSDKSGPPMAGVLPGTTVLYGAKTPAARLTIGPDGDIVVTPAAGQPITVAHPSGAYIRITAAGALEAQAASAQDVTVNGGTKRVAREEDGLNVGTLVGTAGPYPVLFTYVPGAPGAIPPAPPGGVSLRGVIATGQGAANFKG